MSNSQKRKENNILIKKVQAKKLVNFTEFFFGYFPFSDSKILILMENIQNKKIRETDLFDFTSFFGLDILID